MIYIHSMKSRISGGRARTEVRVCNILSALLYYYIIIVFLYRYAIRRDDCHAKYCTLLLLILLLLCHRERCVAVRVSPRRFVVKYSNKDIIIIIVVIMLHVYLRCRTLLENSFRY